jgi:hypothetical protein
MKYIPISECKDGYLYIIKARNARIGIFEETTNSFIIRRIKGKDIYLSKELHWDMDENFGTAKPFEEIEQAIKYDNDKETLEYLRIKADDNERHITEILLKYFYSLTKGE